MAETIGLVILSTLTAEATAWGTVAVVSSTAATVVGTGVLLGGALALSYLVKPDVPKPNDGTQPLKQAIPPRPFGYGRCRISGSYMLFENPEYGAPGDEYSYDVLALHQGEIGGIVHYFLNEDLVYLDGSDLVFHFANDDDRRYGIDGTQAVLIETRLGLDTETAYTTVTAALPELWTSAHRGDGIASLMLRCRANSNLENFPKTFPRGLPKPSVVADLSAVYDPRIDDFTVSTNPVLQLLDYLTSEDRGLGLDWDDVIEPVDDGLMDEADICDELVTKADGSTEKRYQSSGWAYLTTDPAEVIGALLASCDGWMAEAGDGTLVLKVGKYRAPTITLTDDHIVGFSIDHGVPDEEVVNEIRFSFTAPGNDYRAADGNAFQDAASIAEIGRIRSRSQSYDWVQSHSQCRRLAKRAMARSVATMRGSLVTSLYGLQVLGQRWVKVQSGEIDDLSDAVIEISRAKVDIQNARVAFEWTLVNPNAIDAWDAATEEGTAPTFDSQLTPLPRNATVSSPGGGVIRVVIDEPPGGRTDLTYAVEYKLAAASVWTRQVFASPTDLGDTLQMDTIALPAGTYHVRVASIGAGAGGALSPWTTTDSIVL